ncbi:A-kinase anchor protein 9-like isoform X3 [Littorina saxatilis]|uniref:A-kinase anchor protein 9-like isoform X3 n=1 Tax=Littorina saxatilis TaxID=31220 RepID=UPI0038B54C0B
MEQEDRKKKLAAGKEKLAAFRKKRAKKKKTATGSETDNGEGPVQQESLHSAQTSANGVDDGNATNELNLSDFNSFTGDSDQYSLTSGDEWSGEESELHAAVHYQTKLLAATDRIAELEETVEGKQLALDRMTMELHLSNSPQKNVEDRLAEQETANGVNGTPSELEDALLQRDKIIRQLTARLQETAGLKSLSTSIEEPDYLQETQRLSQQVVMLQRQLAQAGETVHQQVAMCQMSVRALQDAKTQILALQDKVTEKNDLLQDLSLSLNSRSSEVEALKQREAELERLVGELSQQAAKDGNQESGTVQPADSQLHALEEELGRLGSEHALSLKTMDELKQRLSLSETSRQALINEKEEALGRIMGLEEELNQLGHVKDEALTKMSELEHKVHESAALLQTEYMGRHEAGARIAQLERELNAKQSVEVAQLSRTHSSSQASPADSTGSPQGLSDLKNVINSQQGELLSLHQQLQSAEAKLSSSREEAVMLREQLEKLQNQDNVEQAETSAIILDLQQEVDSLSSENDRYQKQAVMMEQQVNSFKDLLKPLSSLPVSDAMQEEGASVLAIFNLDQLESEPVITKRMQALHRAYAHLMTEYTQTLEKNRHLVTEARAASEAASDAEENGKDLQHLAVVVARLQTEADEWKTLVQDKDTELEKMNNQLKEVMKEKEQIVSGVRLQEEMTELKTLDSDTLQRKMETRVNTLFSEVSEYKKALKESEAANMELQEKLDQQTTEADSLKMQLEANEDLMKEQQGKASADDNDILTRLQQAEAELQVALEDSKVVVHLRADLEEKNLQLQAVQRAKELAEEEARVKHSKHEEDLKAVQLQLAGILEQHQAALTEQEHLVTSHREEILRLEDNLQHKTTELESMMNEKDQTAALLVTLQEQKTQEVQKICSELDQKSHELHDIVAEKEHILTEMKTVSEDREADIQKVQVQLEEKSREVEKLWADLASVKADKESELDVQLLEKTKEAEQVIAEKEHLLATFQSADTDRNQQLQDLQVKLDQKNEECQSLLSEKEELANQLSFHRSASSEQLTNLHEKLQQKGQECEIIWAENERHREELQSQSAISMKETQRLKQDLEQQTQRFQILLSDWESLDTDLHSRESAFRSSLQKNQQKLQEAAAELEEVKGQLLSVTETVTEKDGTVKNLHTEVEQLKERLTVAQAAGDEASQQTQQTLQTLQSRVHELEQEVDSKREENDTLMSRLAGQADMFKVKEEEMVAENNVLNHQLEEARNDAKETASQLQRERDDLQEQLDTARSSLHDDLKETRRERDTRVKSLQLEIDQIQQEHGRQMTDLETEIFHLNDKNKSLQDQLDSCATEIEELQQKLKGSVAETEQVEADKERLVHQQEAMQLDFTSQLELAQSQIAAKDSELQALQTQVEESAAQQKDLIQALQEEVAAAQSEIVQKESDLASATDKLKFVTEEKEMLKNNFDCCMEEMTQRANDRDNTIRHLQSRLAEACQNVDRDQGQLRELYESQLSEFEDRLATADLEVQRLEKVADIVNAEKDKLKESFNGQIAELELAVQAAESQSSRLKEQMSKMTESHEKEIDDLKHSHEIQIGSLEEHCQSLEKALSKQDALMAEANSKFERDRADRERTYEQQLSDAYEQGRMHELDVSRVKRQMDEMRKDHQKEKQALEKSKETEIFDLENKYVIATTELERLRKSLWGMENDYSGETQALHNRIQELEAVSHSQEKQISDLQDRLMQSSEKLDDSVVTLRESYQSEVGHIEELNQRLSEDVERLQEQLKTTQRTHAQEMEALKHQHNTDVSVVQERCRQAENYSHVLQSHMDSASPSSENHPEVYILRAEAERLQQELVASETSVARLQQKLKEEQASSQSKLSELKSKVEGLTSDKDAKESRIQHLTEDLENEKQMLHESQMICQDLEEENKQLSAENTSLHELSPPPESRFVSSEEDGAVAELKQTINHLTQEMQRIQTARNREENAGTAAEGGFEPEPDSLEYLDLATEPKASEDFFVEETEGSKSPVQSSAKMRTKSVPSETFMGMEIESAHIMLRTVLQSLDTVNMSGLTPSSDAVVHGFQPESPVTQYPATGAPNLSFLPLNVGVLSEQTNTENKFVELVDSGSQTERTYTESIVQESVSDHAESLMQPQKAEHPGETLQNAGDSGENMAEDGEADFAGRLKGVQDQLEEEWVLKMRSQEVELRHSYDEEFREFQRQTEHQCQQQIQQVKQETQASFVDAVRKMRKSLERKQKQTLALKDKVMAKGSKVDSDVPDGADGENLGEIVKQLHEENQELAEVRDVLLKEIDISQTRGRHNTMQHELSGKMSPSQSLKLSSGVDSGSPPIADPAAQQTEAQQLVASHSHTATAMHPDKDDDDDTNKDSTPTAGSDNDDEGSEGSCVRDRFLEELEEMSQQSGQDLPLEWELTSTTVSHVSTSGAGSASVFECDQMGSSSVWEVFDGRCLRQDCRELESVKRQYEAEMEALRQQLEGQREHSNHVDTQLHSQYSQAMSSLREALQDSGQQKELDAVVGQLQELHQRQLQQLNAQHLHDTALQVTAMKLTVEQVQTSRLKLLEEEHQAAVQSLKKQHKEQLNTLTTQLPNGDGVPLLSASEELTQQYQSLVQKINERLQKDILGRLHGSAEEESDEQPKTNGISPDTLSTQQVEAIQQALQVQQEEVLSLRSKLLQDYESVLQQRSEDVSQQTHDVQRLQEQMAELQQQYDKQIAEFQTRISRQNEEEEQRRLEQQQRECDLEEVKAKYEQRISEMENAFTNQISAVQQTATFAPAGPRPGGESIDVGDGGDSGQVGEDSGDSDSLSLKLAQERDYYHKTATLTAISDVESDTADSPRASAEAAARSSPSSSAKVQELQDTLLEKTAHLAELEKCLEEEREKVNDLASQLDVASKKLREVSSELQQQREASQELEKSLAERDGHLEQLQQEQAESQKLLQEMTEKETNTQKEKEDLAEQLRQLQEMGVGGDTLVTSTPTVENELQKLRVSLAESASALQAAETREAELQERLAEVEHQHKEALEELRQELEHEAQMERETLQSEYKVQLEVELKRQAAELKKKFSEEQRMSDSDSGRTSGDADVLCTPDEPHSEQDVQVMLKSSQEISPPPSLGSRDTVITTEPLLTSQDPEPSQSSEVTWSDDTTVREGERVVGVSESAVCEDSGFLTFVPVTTSFGVGSSVDGANPLSSQLVDRQRVAAELQTDFDRRVAELCQNFETEKSQLEQAHKERLSELEEKLKDAEEKYNNLKEDVEEREGAGVETLLKDRYDMELELAKNLMQQEFDETLQSEKKKFVERHRKLMDDFMADRESEATEIKQKHEQELETLKSTLSAEYTTQIATLQTELEQLHSSDSARSGPDETSSPRETLEGTEPGEDSKALSDLEKELEDTRGQLKAAKSHHEETLAALKEECEARITELKSQHQDELEAVALDTDVVKSELEQAHQAEISCLREQIQEAQADTASTSSNAKPQADTASTSSNAKPQEETASGIAAVKHAPSVPQHVVCTSGPEAMHAVSEISLPLELSFQSLPPNSHEGEVRSSQEYEETDEEGSTHSFSSMLGKARTFADIVKTSSPPTATSPPPTTSSPMEEDKVKQLEAQVERLTQLLAQQQQPVQQMMTAAAASNTASPPPTSHTASTATSPTPGATAAATASQSGGGDQNLMTMLQSDLDRISVERNAVQQTNNRLLQLLSDSVHTYVEVEDTINRRLHSVVAASAPRPYTPTLHSRPDSHMDLVTPRGAGLGSLSSVSGAGAMSSPQSDHSWRHRDADTSSPTLEETSILSNATDEGLDMSQRLTESIFTGPDIDAEGEEIVSDARGRLQNAVTRLLEMIERTTQQLMEAKATQSDLLENMAARSRENDDLAARLRDLEEQVRQEVAAKEYLGLELHKAEGLISGYSSERESLEEQLHSLEEQKEVLASDLETTRSRLQEFQDATGELEARRQDVERQQSLLQDNAGQEAQESAMAGGDASVSEQKALLSEMNHLKQESREQTLQLQHRLSAAQRRLQERESSIEETEKEHQRQLEELRKQAEDLKLQLENIDRQLKSNKLFLDEQMTEREQEREEFHKEVENLKAQLLNKEKHSDAEARRQREIQDLSEQLEARIESQTRMHQKTQELQQSLQEQDLSAQDLRVWINTLEQELDQRGDTEEQLKGRIQNLERRLTVGEVDSLSDQSASPAITPRPDSPGTSPMSPTRPSYQRRQSRISLEDELRRSRQAEEELVHEKEALQRTVQEQLLQISALRNQQDEQRHWTGPTDPNATSSSTTTADLRDQLDTEREKLEKAEEELSKVKAAHEGLEKELEEKKQETEQLRQQVQDSTESSQRVKELEEERAALQNRITELSDAGPFPPELLDEKNAEIEELREQLKKTESEFGSLEAQLKEKEELVSDLQDTMHSLQRGESCLDVSLSFNEPLPLNASFTERDGYPLPLHLQEEYERPSSVTSLAQELDQSVGEREARIAELGAEVEHLASQLAEQQEELEQLHSDKTALETELQQRDEDFSHLQEERSQKQEVLVEKESRSEQLLEQVNSLHTEITSLTSFQTELQKDFDTVQSMLDEKEREIESLTKELLDSRSQTEGSDVSDLEAELVAVQKQLQQQRNIVDEKEEELYELTDKLEAMESMKTELSSLKTQLSEKDQEMQKEKNSRTQLQQELLERAEELEKEKQRRTELQQEVEEMQRVERAGRGRAHSFPNINVKPLEDQVRELRAEVFHLENVVKDKEELVRYLEEEKATENSLQDKDLANLRLQLESAQDNMAAKVAQLEQALNDTQHQLRDMESQKQETESQKQEELEKLQQQLGRQAESMQHLETEQESLRQETEQHKATISDLRTEAAQLEEQLEQTKSASTATDDVKVLQEKLQQAGERAAELEEQVTAAQTRLDQTAAQLAEREEQIQQLQAEVQTQQQQRQQRDSVSLPKTPDSGEDSEADERLNDVLSRAQRMQALVKDSLSSSLPMSAQAEASSLSRWESEPGLSSGAGLEIAAKAQDTENWLRRQQRVLAAKNRELANVRQELEAWLRRKDRAPPVNQYSASVMTMTLRLQEKELLITSLKRELMEAKDLLAETERSNAEIASSSGSQSLSPQTQQQIHHLRSELRRARAALATMQERSGSESEGGEEMEDKDRVQKMEAELTLLRSSVGMSAQDFARKVQELREELSEEHQRHVRDIQEAARQDLEIKLRELQAQHDHEMQQTQQLHRRRMQQALEQQQQELEKQHKTEVNEMRVKHQQEIDRLRDEELASLSDASVAQRLHADISATQQMDQRIIGALAADDTHSQVFPTELQALLDRLREAGEHILSVSELDFLKRHLSPSRDVPDDVLQGAWEGEKLSLVKIIEALKQLLSQADRAGAGVDEASEDWRSDLVHALVAVYKQERLGLEAELHTLRLQHPGQDHVNTITNFDNRLQEQERLHQTGLDAILREERQSLLTEVESLQSRLSQQRQEVQDLRSQMAESLAQQEENSSNKTWKLQREVQVLDYKLQQEKVIEEDLRKGLEAERRRVAELSSELSRDKGTLISVQSELQSTQLHLARTKDALEREQNRFTSVTRDWSSSLDALEEEREKNSHLAEKVETLRRHHNSMESDVSRSEALRRERENADSRFIKELQAELAVEREQLNQAVEVAEEERRQRKQLEAEMETEQQQTEVVSKELEKLRHQTKRALDSETTKLSDMQRVWQQDQERLLAERDSTIQQQSANIRQLHQQVQKLQGKVSSLKQEVETERQKGDSLAALMDRERQQLQAVRDQEQANANQLRHDLQHAKTEAGEARRHLELEKSRGDNMRMELERVQSEMRALTQHAGATEQQLENEHSSTWNKLRVAQRDRDDMQVKVHELELELDRLQDKLQDLELELDRSRQREIEAKHDLERHKLYPSASPRSAPVTPRGTTDAQLQSRLNGFCRKLQGVGQRLQTLTLQQRDHNNSATAHSDASSRERSAVDGLMAELQDLQKKMTPGVDQVDGGGQAESSRQETEELHDTIRQLTKEREELQRRLHLLEDQDNVRTSRSACSHRQPQEGMPLYVSDVATSDDEFLYERTVWASERLSLQMALDSAEHEIDRLKKELRSFRGRFNSEGFMMDADRDKMQRLYGKYLRAESFRKALVYQKKYLLLLLGGYQDSESETLAVIATMGGQPSSTLDLAYRRGHRRLYTMFRSAARMVVAIFRMKYLVRKWRRATRVGSPVVGGRVNQQFGYVATPSSFTTPNTTEHHHHDTSSSTSAHVHTLNRHHTPPVANGSALVVQRNLSSSHPAGDMGRRFYTPPTKDIGQSHRAASSPSSSTARRQLMTELEGSQPASSGTDNSGGGGAVGRANDHDDFIQRLENLQSRLSGSSPQNGDHPQQRSSWR